MAYTQSDLLALDTEIASVRTIKATTFSDQSTTFRSLDELLRLRTVMIAEIGLAANSGSRTRYASTSKGTGSGGGFGGVNEGNYGWRRQG